MFSRNKPAAAKAAVGRSTSKENLGASKKGSGGGDDDDSLLLPQRSMSAYDFTPSAASGGSSFTANKLSRDWGEVTPPGPTPSGASFAGSSSLSRRGSVEPRAGLNRSNSIVHSGGSNVSGSGNAVDVHAKVRKDPGSNRGNKVASSDSLAQRSGSLTDDAGLQRGGSLTADGANPAYLLAPRPACASEEQDDLFCVEDEQAVGVLETVLEALSVSDPRHEANPLVYVSAGFESVTGFSAADALGRSAKLLNGKNADADADVVAAGSSPSRGGSGGSPVKAALAASTFVAATLAHVKKSGASFSDLVCMMPYIESGARNASKWVTVHCDLDAKRRRDAIASLGDDDGFAARWQGQMQHLLTAMFLLDASDEQLPILNVNDAFSAMLGYSPQELQGASAIGALCGKKTDKAFMRSFGKMLRGEKAAAHRLLCYKKDGSPLWLYLHHMPLRASAAAATGGAKAAQQPAGALAPTLVVAVDVTLQKLQRMGRWVVGKVIGQGAFGVVSIGRNTVTGELAAIKAVDASNFTSINEIEQMQEEMAVLTRLKHDNIIRLHETHLVDNVFYLVTEYAAGGSLVSYTKKQPGGRLSDEQAKKVFHQMVSALDYCHRRRIIHRDLKPENVLMTEADDVKVCDFGMAGVSGFNEGETVKCGTPAFLAPEVLANDEYDGAAADIWSLGVMMYEAVAGRLPFDTESQSELQRLIRAGSYPPLPDTVSSDLRNLIKAILVVDPLKRLTLAQIMAHPWCSGMRESVDDMGSPTESGKSKSLGEEPMRQSLRLVIDTGGSGGGDDIFARAMQKAAAEKEAAAEAAAADTPAREVMRTTSFAGSRRSNPSSLSSLTPSESGRRAGSDATRSGVAAAAGAGSSFTGARASPSIRSHSVTAATPTASAGSASSLGTRTRFGATTTTPATGAAAAKSASSTPSVVSTSGSSMSRKAGGLNTSFTGAAKR